MKLTLQNTSLLGEIGTVAIERFPFIIGRRSDSDCCLSLAFISRHHCRFTRNDGQILVQDLESHNGTFVNGRLASVPLRIQDGDELCLGPIAFRVVMEPTTPETCEVKLEGTKEEDAFLGDEGVPQSSGEERG